MPLQTRHTSRDPSNKGQERSFPIMSNYPQLSPTQNERPLQDIYDDGEVHSELITPTRFEDTYTSQYLSKLKR